jgi:hypothetical protein
VTPGDGRLEGVSFSKPDTNTPAGVLAPPSQVAPPQGLRQPAGQGRKLYIVLTALLVAIVGGAGLVYAFLVPKSTTTPPPANAVVGQVRFLSSPSAVPQGSIDEVKITFQHISNAPAGEQYYAWLLINSESLFPIHWKLTSQNGSLTSSYLNPQHTNLLTNKPYLFLITLETADKTAFNETPSLDPNARFYYARLPGTIQNLATFDIQSCPQTGSNNPCMS